MDTLIGVSYNIKACLGLSFLPFKHIYMPIIRYSNSIQTLLSRCHKHTTKHFKYH